MACKEVPLVLRLFYGVLAREGMRESEAINLLWNRLDLEHGSLTLDENKSDDARAWALDAWRGPRVEALEETPASEARDDRARLPRCERRHPR